MEVILGLSVRVPALTVIVRVPVPVPKERLEPPPLDPPMFRSLVPVNVKSPLIVTARVVLALSIIAAPLVLSSVPPLIVTELPTPPVAAALLMFSVPLFRTVPPV